MAAGLAIATIIAAGLLVSYLAGASSQPPVTIQSWDFETDTGQWGVHLTGGLPDPLRGVEVDCASDLGAPSGRCALAVSVAALESRDQDVYVAVESRVEAGARMTARIMIEGGVPTCTGPPAVRCTTARLIVWDRVGLSHEGPAIELPARVGVDAAWPELSVRLEDEYQRPLRRVGVHIFRPVPFDGLVYLDQVAVLGSRDP